METQLKNNNETIQSDIDKHIDDYLSFTKEKTCCIMTEKNGEYSKCDKIIYSGILCYNHAIIHNKMHEKQSEKLYKDYKNIVYKYC